MPDRDPKPGETWYRKGFPKERVGICCLPRISGKVHVCHYRGGLDRARPENNNVLSLDTFLEYFKSILGATDDRC